MPSTLTMLDTDLPADAACAFCHGASGARLIAYRPDASYPAESYYECFDCADLDDDDPTAVSIITARPTPVTPPAAITTSDAEYAKRSPLPAHVIDARSGWPTGTTAALRDGTHPAALNAAELDAVYRAGR